jgi:hypothetical protein
VIFSIRVGDGSVGGGYRREGWLNDIFGFDGLFGDVSGQHSDPGAVVNDPQFESGNVHAKTHRLFTSYAMLNREVTT